MNNSLFKNIFRSEEYTYEMQNFNLVQLIYLIGLMLMSGVIYVCISDPIYVYVTIVLCFLLLASIVDANRTGKLKKSACIISVVSNFIYLPLCYYGFGKLICCVPLYFILGILYTVLLINGKLGAFLSIIEMIYLCIIIVVLGNKLPGFTTNPVTELDYVAIIIAVVIAAVFSAVAIKIKVRHYDLEFEKLQGAHLKVQEAYESKDIFFANTSHEIRTPLNAIVGTVNLLLDEELDPQVRDNVYNILNSCNALLSITDELMELSNTENNDMTLTESKFDFSEIISEVVNMMSVRLMESTVTLYVDIDKSVPKYIWGDRAKVRQLLINILNNAVKYTKEGKIVFRVSTVRNDDGLLLIKVVVEDTGIGIKKEILPKLFNYYKRDDDDSEKRGIEGTGLGLSLCKEIIQKMGGDIYVESEYHVGSTFSFVFPQRIEFKEPISYISDKSHKEAIIFEKNDELAESLHDILSSLKIESVIVSDRMEFEASVLSCKYHYVFIAIERYLENQGFIERKLENHRMVLISDISQGVQVEKSCYMLTRPAHIINVVMAYNNKTDLFSREIIQSGGFTCPDSTILVVDDNLTNLEVASGLLKKYDATIVTAISGNDCIKVFDNMHVDIVFLDYMMPEMNGIDTLNALRKLDSENAKTVPVVALTANVVSGAKQMFKNAGFCEYIAKPIDVSKLETTLKNNLPREQLKIKI